MFAVCAFVVFLRPFALGLMNWRSFLLCCLESLDNPLVVLVYWAILTRVLVFTRSGIPALYLRYGEVPTQDTYGRLFRVRVLLPRSVSSLTRKKSIYFRVLLQLLPNTDFCLFNNWRCLFWRFVAPFFVSTDYVDTSLQHQRTIELREKEGEVRLKSGTYYLGGQEGTRGLLRF